MSPAAVDWRISERRRARQDPEFRIELAKVIEKLLATGSDEDRHVAFDLAESILELNFHSTPELLEQLRETAPSDIHQPTPTARRQNYAHSTHRQR